MDEAGSADEVLDGGDHVVITSQSAIAKESSNELEGSVCGETAGLGIMASVLEAETVVLINAVLVV